ncbi:16S rRNA (uracil(1498)-N(3))-methyltransferase [Congregibacter litoralis]|uniref:Ribosomal RNA small subunit methyltransferase E n=1 Tax=Congregibacter litoralis KT71 TaxID=314285 RepID=A4A9E3_9GAMM|nr:16S rRNA (uracil(1498)-N(3))-methyltransferase [Congregibacter litoralis]EAQ97685.1 methyltransferase [Congregibacter litoralis KT71]
MLRPRFFTAQTLSEGSTLTLEKEPSRHIAKALRMRAGDSLCLFDGSGIEAHGEISDLDKSQVSVIVKSIQQPTRESPLDTVLIIALSRGDRMDTVVQKATELGVTEIWPMISERTGVRLDETRLARKRQHWERIAISACEQCGRNRLPTVETPTSFEETLQRAAKGDDSLRLILHTSAHPSPLPTHCKSLTLLVGPEGGFSDEEVTAALDQGFCALQMGPRILRTETAPLVGLALAQARWGDISL